MSYCVFLTQLIPITKLNSPYKYFCHVNIYMSKVMMINQYAADVYV